MPTKNTTLRNDLANAFGDIWDGATLEVKDSGGSVLVTYTLPTPAFSSASNGSVTLQETPITETASASGTADHATLTNSDETRILDNISVSESDGMIIINNTSIVNNQAIELQSFQWTEVSTFSN